MRDTFYLDGENAEKYGIYLQKPVKISGAMPDVKVVKVPGRNGALTLPTGAFKNRTGEARCYVLQTNVSEAVACASAWLLSDPGYRRLTCSNDPKHFWLARITNGPEIDDRLNTLNPFKIKFDVMPQKWVTGGELPIVLTKSVKLINQYGMEARPLITVYGSGAGELTVGGATVKINTLSDSLTLDCENGNAYNGIENLNKNITAPEFPVLKRGENQISWTGGIKKIEIVPRWCDL